MKKPFRPYSGKEIFTLSEEKKQPIVEGFLYENDYVMITAQPKTGKSILVQQLAINLSSGTPFLDVLTVPKPVKVWYFATEGKDEDIKDRMIRISHAVQANPDNLVLFCSAGIRFNTPMGKKLLEDLVNAADRDKCLPKVIIIDALYRAIKGSLKDDETVNDFQEVVCSMADKCDAALIIVHHMRKKQFFQDGSTAKASDDDTYGSAFLKAAVDQMYWLEKCEKNERDVLLKCDTQRSGKIMESYRLTLLEPDPLHFKIISLHQEEVHRLLTILSSSKLPLDVTTLKKRTGLTKSVLYAVLKEMTDSGQIKKSGNYNSSYSV